MSLGIIPDSAHNSVIIRDVAGEATDPDGVNNAYVPEPEFVSSALLRALPTGCDGKYDPDQINAIVSELLALGETLVPDGTWTLSALNNLATLFQAWRDGTAAGTLDAAVRVISDRITWIVANIGTSGTPIWSPGDARGKCYRLVWYGDGITNIKISPDNGTTYTNLWTSSPTLHATRTHDFVISIGTAGKVFVNGLVLNSSDALVHPWGGPAIPSGTITSAWKISVTGAFTTTEARMQRLA